MVGVKSILTIVFIVATTKSRRDLRIHIKSPLTASIVVVEKWRSINLYRLQQVASRENNNLSLAASSLSRKQQQRVLLEEKQN